MRVEVQDSIEYSFQLKILEIGLFLSASEEEMIKLVTGDVFNETHYVS